MYYNLMNKKTYQIVGKKFLQTTQQFRSVRPRKIRQQLQSIIKIPRSNQYFQGTFPLFPIQSQWKYSNLSLRSVTWKPKKTPRALVVGYHCLNGHSGLSSILAKKLSQSECIFTSFDYPNFGKSQGQQRGHIASINDNIKCCNDFLHHSINQYPSLPVFVFGYSLGGLMAFRVGLKNQNNLKGCVFINPSLQDNIIKDRLLKSLALIVGGIFPKLRIFKPSGGQSSKYLLHKYKQKDPLMYGGKLWTSTSSQILGCMLKSRQLFKDFNLPYLYIQGGSDKIVNPFVSFQFQNQTQSEDKQTVIIHDLWHSLWFDDHLHDVIDMTQSWIKQRITK